MDWRHTTFIGSWPKLALLPKPRLAEVAIVGRSNVGKSSLINSLCFAPKLAKTSSTPGKTQEWVFFEVDGKLHLVDLPGYGYAKASHSLITNWEQIEQYLSTRATACILLVDIRHGLNAMDRQFLEWLNHHKREYQVILTKADKLTRNQINQAKQKLQAELGNPVSAVSQQDPLSIDALRKYLFEPYTKPEYLPFRKNLDQEKPNQEKSEQTKPPEELKREELKRAETTRDETKWDENQR